jgi:hypothetical protein
MRDFHLGPEVRPEPLRFSGAANGGSLISSAPSSPFSDAEETELAFELLRVKNDADLEQLLTHLFKKAWKGTKPVGSKIAKPLGEFLGEVAKSALPFVAAAAGRFLGRPTGSTVAGKLGSLIRQALEADAAGVAAAGRDLEKCRQFVRLAGKAARAAASAPTGINPIAAAGKILADSAREKITQKAAPAARAGRFTEGAPPATAMKPTAPTGPLAAQKPHIKTQAPGEPICTICELPPGACQCKKISRSGRWFRSGSSIIVNC